MASTAAPDEPVKSSLSIRSKTLTKNEPSWTRVDEAEDVEANESFLAVLLLIRQQKDNYYWKEPVARNSTSTMGGLLFGYMRARTRPLDASSAGPSIQTWNAREDNIMKSILD
jgi:hypothetical protein